MINVSLREFTLHSIGHFQITFSLYRKASIGVHPSCKWFFSRPRFDSEVKGNLQIYTSELILCSTFCVHSATRHNIHMLIIK